MTGTMAVRVPNEPLLSGLFQAIRLEEMGLTPKIRKRPVPKMDRKALVVDDATPSAILNSVDVSLRQRLSTRKPDLTKILPETENGVEPKCHLAFLDNKDGAVCLSVVNPSNLDERTITLADLVGKLDEGNPGLFAPQESKATAPVSGFRTKSDTDIGLTLLFFEFS